MPGIVGFTLGSIRKEESPLVLARMRESITHFDFYRTDELFLDDHVAATRSHLGIIENGREPFKGAESYVWLEGEFYNQDELAGKYGLSAKSDPSILAELYAKDRDLGFLKDIDGYFSAVIYDTKSKKLHLTADRYGLKHIYWTVFKDSLFFASEFKSFLEIPEYSARIDKSAVLNFMKYGQLMTDETWFKGVELLSTGSVLTWDLVTRSLIKKRYWWWDRIRPYEGRSSDEDLADELGRLFVESVAGRMKGDDIGLMLSGGADSRAILAAMPKEKKIINAVTFGKEDSDDVRIAKRVVKIRAISHHVVNIDSQNWLFPRFRYLWYGDGQIDLFHMHGAEALERIRELFKINMHGLGGGAILGDAYFRDPEWRVIEKIEHRQRRLIILGPKISGVLFESRLPFVSYKLVDFILSLPEEKRDRYCLYKKMLLRLFPEYYGNIPWQHTGLPMSFPVWAEDIYKYSKGLKSRFKNLLKHLGLSLKSRDTYDFFDYANWITKEPARSFFINTLKNPNALYPEYLDHDTVSGDVDAHMGGDDRSQMLCRYLTLEIYLNQVFEDKYRQ